MDPMEFLPVPAHSCRAVRALRGSESVSRLDLEVRVGKGLAGGFHLGI